MFTVRIYHIGITVSRGGGNQKILWGLLGFQEEGRGDQSSLRVQSGGGGGGRGLEKIDC